MNRLILICGFAVMFVAASCLLADDAFAQCTLICPFGDGAVTAAGPPATRPVDFNADGVIDLIDFALLVCGYPPNPYDPCFDFDCNGVVDLADLALWIQHYCHSGINPSGVCAGP